MPFAANDFRDQRRAAGFTQARLAQELELSIERVSAIAKGALLTRVEEYALRYVFQTSQKPGGPGGRPEFLCGLNHISDTSREFGIMPRTMLHPPIQWNELGKALLLHRGVEEVFRRTANDGSVGLTVVAAADFSDELVERLKTYWCGAGLDPNEIRLLLADENVPRWESEGLLADVKMIPGVADAWIIHIPEGDVIPMMLEVSSMEERLKVFAAAKEKMARVSTKG